MSASTEHSAGTGTGMGTGIGTGTGTGSGERAVPYSCPFCAEEDLRPLESGAVPGPPPLASAPSTSSGDRPPLESDRS